MSSAITVCAKNLGDEQLALVICRLIEGHGGPIKKHLVSSYLLPNAMEKSDYWLQSFFQVQLGPLIGILAYEICGCFFH